MGDAACKLKIILDGGNASRLIESICETTQAADASLFTDEAAYPIIKNLNTMEDLAVETQKMLVKVIHYDGPLPKLLS